MTDVIRVDPNTLHFYAGQITGIALSLRQLGSEVSAATSNAPSYDGQFGPRVASVGQEAAARYQALAGRLEALSTQLRTKADEFIQADLAAEAAMMGAPPPGTGIGLAELFEEIPWWVILILGVLPFGDALGLLEELINSLSGRGVSQLNLWLSIFGLAADAGWIDLIIPDPVDGINVGLAGIKAAVRTLGRLPPSAEKILLESLQAAVKNPDDLARVGKVLAALAANTDLARRVIADDAAFEALLRMKNGPEFFETIAKGGDDLLAQIPPNAAVRTSDLAQEYGFDIHIAGRLADTLAENTKRIQALEQAQLRAFERAAAEGIPFDQAFSQEVIRAADEFGMNPHQVKLSSGPPNMGPSTAEVDAFVPYEQWQKYIGDSADAALQEYMQKNGIENLADIDPQQASQILSDAAQQADEAFRAKLLDVHFPGDPYAKADLYQTLSPKPGWPDPKTNIPRGAVSFGADGSITHTPLGNP